MRRWVLGFTNIAQTVPSLALFGFLLPFIGIGEHTAILALSLYALLPILRSTLTGILGVDPGVRESAMAMGMTPRQILWQVELPLAVPSIVSGLRIATVTTIGTATIAASTTPAVGRVPWCAASAMMWINSFCSRACNCRLLRWRC